MLEIDKMPEPLSTTSALKTHLIGAAVFLIAITVFYVSPNLQVFDSNYSMLLSEVVLQGHTVDLSRVPFRTDQTDPRDLRDGYPYHVINVKNRQSLQATKDP
jgi:hypothetical protein